MRLLPNEFALTHSPASRSRRSAPPVIGWGLLLGMAPILLVYWLLLAPVMVAGGVLRFARPAQAG